MVSGVVLIAIRVASVLVLITSKVTLGDCQIRSVSGSMKVRRVLMLIGLVVFEAQCVFIELADLYGIDSLSVFSKGH